MTVLSESKTERLVYKAYAASTYDATVEPVPSVDPAVTGGQVLRHVSHNLSLVKENYRPNEIRQDLQRPMGHHGSRTVSGTINGYASPGTHADLFKYCFRAPSWTAAVALDYSDLTSVTGTASSSKFTFGSGDPVALGLRRGMGFRLTDVASDNAGKTFIILGFGGSSNREVTVYPAPVDMMADSVFSLSTVGKTLVQPSAGPTNWKVGWEVYNADSDLSRLFTECRMGGFDMTIGVNANVTLNFNLMGRNRKIFETSSAPFFTAPTSETTTDIPTGMQGLLRLNGVTLGVLTAVSLKMALNPQAAKIIHPDGLVGAIFLEDAMIDGSLTTFLDPSMMEAFDEETEMELLAYLPSTNADAAPAQCFYLPRIKINTNNESDQEGGKVLQCDFEAGRYSGSTAGIASTTLQIWDTNAV